MPEIYAKAQKNFDAYLTRLEGRTEPQPRPARTQSAPPRMQTVPAARMDTSWHGKVDQETDDRNRYHTKGAATSPPVKTMPHGSSRRPTALPRARGAPSRCPN